MTRPDSRAPGWARALGLAALFAAGLALSACNTAEGIGEDVEAAGEALQEETDVE